MRRIGFLGCGKIGKALVRHIAEREDMAVEFIQDPGFANDIGIQCPVLAKADEVAFAGADLIVECATAQVLSENLELILAHCDLMMFSVTAFGDPDFERRAKALCGTYGRTIFIPHGAILGLNGIFDGGPVWRQVTVETVKSPTSLGRQDNCRSVVYEGPTREACVHFPRNVNVHAAVALAGIGFDRTISRIISDPEVSTNAHRISLSGDGISITLDISSYAAGAVTGAYTLYSACGSLDRALGNGAGLRFV